MVESASRKPNVLFMVGDDLAADMGHLGHPFAKTPNLDKLAANGVSFRHAVSNHPVCAPSRSSFMTGILGQTSKNFFFDKWYLNPVLNQSKTMPEYFHENGYRVLGTGKLMHDERATPSHPTDGWDEYYKNTDYGPIASNGKGWQPHPSLPLPLSDPDQYDGIDCNFARLSDVPFKEIDNGGWIYGNSTRMRYVNENDRDLTPDELNADWAANRIKKLANEDDGVPFFMGVGFIRPHMPLYVPDKYFDMFPVDRLRDPVNEDDTGTFMKNISVVNKTKGLRYYRDVRLAYPMDGIRRFMQAYLAGVASTDANVGKVLDALDSTHLKKNTIVIVTGDHGFSIGSHGWLFKQGPWDVTTQVPLIVRAAGVPSSLGSIVEHPVSLVDIYPTLVDLCGLVGPTTKSSAGAPLDGFSLRPFLEGKVAWNGPSGAVSGIWAPETDRKELLPKKPWAVCKTDVKCQHWTIRTQQFRYIRYNDGSEELYDHLKDLHEMENLANMTSMAKQKEKLQAALTALVTKTTYTIV